MLWKKYPAPQTFDQYIFASKTFFQWWDRRFSIFLKIGREPLYATDWQSMPGNSKLKKAYLVVFLSNIREVESQKLILGHFSLLKAKNS